MRLWRQRRRHLSALLLCLPSQTETAAAAASKTKQSRWHSTMGHCLQRHQHCFCWFLVERQTAAARLLFDWFLYQATVHWSVPVSQSVSLCWTVLSAWDLLLFHASKLCGDFFFHCDALVLVFSCVSISSFLYILFKSVNSDDHKASEIKLI